MVRLFSADEMAGRQPSIRRFNRDEIIYLAGIFDGEGSLSSELTYAGPGGRRRYPRITVHNTNDDLIAWLASHGGSIYSRPPVLGSKFIHAWRVTATADVMYLLTEMLPFLIIKRAAAEHALTISRERASAHTGKLFPRESEIVDAYRSGVRVADICERFGLRNTALYRLLTRRGETKRRQHQVRHAQAPRSTTTFVRSLVA